MGMTKIELILPRKANELDELPIPLPMVLNMKKFFLDSTAHHHSKHQLKFN